MREIVRERLIIIPTSIAFCIFADACGRGDHERAAVQATARADSMRPPAHAGSAAPVARAQPARASTRARRTVTPTLTDSTGARVSTDASGRPLAKITDFTGTYHDPPIDSFDLVTIGSRRVEDVPDEGKPCMQGSYDLPFSRLLLFPDSAVSEWRTLRPRCLRAMPQMPLKHYAGWGGKFRLQGDTVTFYWPARGGSEFQWYHGRLTRDSLLPLVPSDTAARYVRLARRAPPPRRVVPPGLVVVGDTFDLIAIGSHAVDWYPMVGECDPAAGPASERFLVLAGGKYLRQWVDRPNCRPARATSGAPDAPHVWKGTYRMHHDTLTFYEVGGSDLYEWMPGILTADSLRETFAVPGLERRYARHPHHQPPPRSPLPELATHLLHRLNPAITSAEVVSAMAATGTSHKQVVLLHGVRRDRVFHGDARDELFVLVQADASLTRIERIIAVIPSPRWLDFDLSLTDATQDSVLVWGWSRTMGDRVASPLDRDPRWLWADAPGWTPWTTTPAGVLMQAGMRRWYKW